MREIITIKMVEQTTKKYIAEDGKEFDTELECAKYELKKRTDEVEFRFNLLNTKRFDIPLLDGYKAEGCVYRITFENRSDVVAFVDYYQLHGYSMYEIKDMVKQIKTYPYTICVDEGYDSVYFFDEAQLLKDLKELINHLEGSKKEIPSNI